MKKRLISLPVSLLLLTMLVLPAGAAAVDLADPDAMLPVDIIIDQDAKEIRKVYDLSPNTDPSTLPMAPFERDGLQYECTDVLREVVIGSETQTITQTETVDSSKKDMETILGLLPQDKEVTTEDKHFRLLQATCAMPLMFPVFHLDGKPYLDGGAADAVPYRRAFEQGCDRVVVILTRPKDYYRDPKKDQRMAKLLRKYPNAARVLALRAETYNRQLEQAHALAQAGKVLLVAPDDIGGMSTLTKDRGAILTMYHKGRSDAKAIGAFLAGK